MDQIIIPSSEALQLAVVVWLLTEVIKKSPWLAQVPCEVVALALGAVLGVAAYLTHWLTGQPVEVFIQVVYAILGAALIQDKIVKPLSAGRL